MKEGNDHVSLMLAKLLVRQLVDSGVSHLVVSPGYRNSPLLLAAHREKGLRVTTAVDERGAAFFALGIAKASGQPAAILCTSGTAVANYFPAVMEASEAQVPLVVITADRPLELIGTGANQCTDQIKVFGSHVRAFTEINCPDLSFPGEEQARYATGRAVARAQEPNPGPVHLNVRFREPFLPTALEQENLPELPPSKGHWKFISSASGPGKEQWEAVELLIGNANRPAIVVGATALSQSTLKKIISFSKSSGFPVFAEAASGLSFLGEEAPYVLSRAEQVLSAIADEKIDCPDLLIRIGAPLTDRAYGRLIAKHAPVQVVFDQWGNFREPFAHPSVLIEGGLDGWLDALNRSHLQILDGPWRRSLLDANEKVESAVTNHLGDTQLTEWFFHRALEEKLLDDSVIFLGNSMPIRDFNSAFPASKKKLRVLSNRGLSGIDGLIASAAGAAFASQKDLHVILGDLSTLHDLSSFSLLSSLKEKIRLTLWVMNNNGGEIFRMVQTAKAGGDPTWFTTPFPYDLASITKGFHLSYGRVFSLASLGDLSPEGVNGFGARVVEVMVEQSASLDQRKKFRPFE